MYDNVKKKAEELQPRVSDLRKKAEGRVVPGGYAKLGDREGVRLVNGDNDHDQKDVDGMRRLPSEDSSSDDDGEGMAGADVNVDADDWSEWDRAKVGADGMTVSNSNSNSAVGSSVGGYTLDPRVRTRDEDGGLLIHAPTPQPIRAEGWRRF